MDRDILPIIDTWTTRVHRLSWSAPDIPHKILDSTGFGPSFWRTCTLQDISHPQFCLNLASTLLKRLHGRNRADLRQHINSAVTTRERSRKLGLIGRVTRSILREEVDMYNLDYLRLPEGGTLTDHRSLHNLITTHFHI